MYCADDFNSFLASVGCVITVTCLALDTMAQQVLVYRTRLMPTSEAWVGQAQTYGGGPNDTCQQICPTILYSPVQVNVVELS
jgi:hypothetical protein